jgi:outer membrane protein assembly factor BamB
MLRRSFLVFILVSTFAVMGCKITGKITNDKGAGIEGITIELSGDASMSTSTDADGIYVFRKINNGAYTVTPFDAENEYAFEPGKKEVKIDRKKKIARADFKAVKSQQPPEPPQLPQWSTYQGNAAHTGYVSVSLNPENFSEEPIWTKIINESDPLNPVAAGDGIVFATTGGDGEPHVATALDSLTGEALWTYEDFSDTTYSVHPPAYANDTVYIQSGVGDDSFLRAFDAESGDLLFETRYVNPFARYYAPTIYDDNENVGVYVGGGGGDTGGVYGFDGINGAELWHVDLNPYEQWTPAVNEDHVIAYTGYFDPQLTVIHRSAGETWEAGEVDFFISDPNFEFGPFSMDLAPVLGSQNNVIVIQGGRLIIFDLENPDNSDNPLQIQGGFSGQPSLANGIIYAVYEGELHALNESDGSFIEEWKPWQPPDDERIDAPMIVTDNLIFVSTASTTYAIDLEKQKEEWSYSAGGHLAISDDGVLFIATTDGRLIAINLYQN